MERAAMLDLLEFSIVDIDCDASTLNRSPSDASAAKNSDSVVTTSDAAGIDSCADVGHHPAIKPNSQIATAEGS